MNYFYRICKVNKHYTLEFKIQFSCEIFKVSSISLDNYLSTHNLHTTGLDCYGLIDAHPIDNFRPVDYFSDWEPLGFISDMSCFSVEFPTNFGYISKRGCFLRTGDYHLLANFRFQDFYSFIADNGI